MREIVRSRQITWSNAARTPVDLSFLDAVLAKYRSAVVEAFYLRFTGSVTTGGGVAFQNYDQCRAVASQFVWKDKRGERINLTGDEIRLVAQMELGQNFQDPADQAGTTTNTSFECILPIVFSTPRARRRADFRPSVAEVVSGDMIWTFGGTNPVTSVTINSGTCELHALVTDEVVPEAASRMSWIGVNATLAEDHYMIDGALRAAFMHSASTNGGSGFSSLATYTEIDSYTLDMVDVPRTVLREKYRHESLSVDNTNDEIVNNNVIPLVYPDRDQKITQMRIVNKLHVRLQAALPSGGRFVYNAVTDRDPVLTAAALQVPPGQLGSIPLEVSTQKGRKDANAFSPDLARKLPISVG